MGITAPISVPGGVDTGGVDGDGCCRLYWWIERCCKFYIFQGERQPIHISASSVSILLFLVSKCLLLREYLACS